MIPLYTTEQFKTAKGKDKLLCECHQCHQPFQALKSNIMGVIRQTKTRKNGVKYCSNRCTGNSLIDPNTFQIVQCKHCGIQFKKATYSIQQKPNSFCSQSCSGKYNNTHKKHGYKRSKLEKYLETQLTTMYPNFKFLFNERETIELELDIYIPKLKLAFELNGIFHFLPIYGNDKLNKVKMRDSKKIQQCVDKNIELHVIDVSKQTAFKISTSDKYLSYIHDTINQRTNTV